jgi:hypothetical protein
MTARRRCGRPGPYEHVVIGGEGLGYLAQEVLPKLRQREVSVYFEGERNRPRSRCGRVGWDKDGPEG